MGSIRMLGSLGARLFAQVKNSICRSVGWGMGLGMSLILICGSSSEACAQTWSEWFRQKKTEERYLLKQVAYLRSYAGYLKKGYDLASSGLGAIKGITSGEMGLHEAFFSSLKMASPVVRGDVRVLALAQLQLRVAGLLAELERAALSLEAKAYVSKVAGLIRSECAVELDELLMVMTSSRLEMEDSGRLARIGRLHTLMLDRMEFLLAFYGEVQQMVRAGENELMQLESLRRFYGKD